MSPVQENSLEKILPLKPADFHILVVVLREDLHGYGIMKALEADSGGRRRYYRITPFGMRVARLEANRLADVVRVARSHVLLGDGEGM